MNISYLEDVGLRLTPKEKNSARVKVPPKLDRSSKSNYDSSPDEKTPRSLVGSRENLLLSCYDSSSWSSYFSQCFTIVDVLGEGSFGKVYKARSRTDQLLYAIKVDKSRVRNAAHRRFKLEEVQRHEELSIHPNIVRLLHAWEENRIIYIQLELCKTSLQALSLKIVDMPEKQIWNVLVDMLWALQHIHHLDFIHLDVKLDNILVGFDGRYKLSDFGLIYNLSNNNGHEPLEGDAKYLAPEVLNNNFTTAADIFSLGISILELATNVALPNQGPVWQELRRNRLPSTQTAHLSEELVSVIAWMMTSDFEVRPSADHLLKHNIILRRIKTRNRELSYNGLKNNFLSVLRLLIINPLRNLVSACYRVANRLLARWIPQSCPVVQRPLIQINGETPVPSETEFPNFQDFEFVPTSSPQYSHQRRPQAPSCKRSTCELSRLRQSPNSSVRRNLFSSFSASDSDSDI